MKKDRAVIILLTMGIVLIFRDLVCDVSAGYDEGLLHASARYAIKSDAHSADPISPFTRHDIYDIAGATGTLLWLIAKPLNEI